MTSSSTRTRPAPYQLLVSARFATFAANFAEI
nr:MAG TPA: hypothetical protein [Caudoviricetes sp.]